MCQSAVVDPSPRGLTPDGFRRSPSREPILDNLSAHKGAEIRRWAMKNKVESCFTPTYASWANPIEAHFGPLKQFTIANSHHQTVQARALHAYLRWRNGNARTATSWPPNARNAPASAAREAFAGAGAPSRQQPEPIRRTNAAVTALGWRYEPRHS